MHPIEWLRAVARSGDVPQAELAGEAAAALSALGDDPQGLLMGCRRLLDRHPTAGTLWWTCARLVTAGDVAAEAGAVQRDLAADQVGLSLTLDLPDDARVTLVGWSEMADELAARRGDLRLLVVAAPDSDMDDGRFSWPGVSRGSGRWGRSGEGSSMPGSGRSRGRGALGGLDLWQRLADDRHPDVVNDVDPDDVVSDDDERITVVPAAELGAAVVDSDVVLLDALAMGDGSFVAASGALAAAAVARQRRAELWLAVGVGRRLPPALFAAMRRQVFGGEDDRAAAPGALGAGVDLVEQALVDRVIEPIEIGCPGPPELLRLA